MSGSGVYGSKASKLIVVWVIAIGCFRIRINKHYTKDMNKFTQILQQQFENMTGYFSTHIAPYSVMKVDRSRDLINSIIEKSASFGICFIILTPTVFEI